MVHYFNIKKLHPFIHLSVSNPYTNCQILSNRLRSKTMPELPPRAPTFPGFIDKLPDETTEDSITTSTTTSNLPDTTTTKINSSSSSPSPLVDMSPDITISHSTSTSTDVPVVPLPVAPRRSRIRAILLWRDPKVSAFVLSCFLLFFYLTLVRALSVLSVIGALFGLYLIIGLITTNANKYTGGKLDTYLARPTSGTPLFKRDALIRALDFVIDEGNDVAEEIRDIIYCDKTPITFAWMTIAFIIYMAGKFCSLLSVLLVAVIGIFTIPILYEKNKKQVDDTLAKASDAASRHIESGRRVAADRAVKLKAAAAEKSAPLLQKAPPAARDFAKKLGFTPKES